MLMVLLGYCFGIAHKVLYSRNWVLWAYVAAMLLVMVDVLLYARNAAIERRESRR